MNIDKINTAKKAGLALKRLRKAQGLSQSDLAKMMNMRQATISDVESGKGTLSSFFKIIQSLKVNLELSDQKNKISKKNKEIERMLDYLENEN